MASSYNNGKKILYIGTFELPDKNAAALRVLGNAKAFRESGNEVIFAGVSQEGCEDNIIKTKYETQGFQTYYRRRPDTLKEWFFFIDEIKQYIQLIEYIKDIDIVIFYNFFSTAMLRINKYCKKRGILCVADITEWYSAKSRKFPVNVIKGIDNEIRMKIIQKHLDGLIVISKYLYEYYKDCKNVIQIPPLVDIDDEKWSGSGKKVRKELLLAYVGVPAKKDKFDVLIKALIQTKRKVRLDVVGVTYEEFISMCPQYQGVNLEEYQIFFHGKLPHRQALEFVKDANYNVFFREVNRVSMAGFPTKFVESISSGTPVITNKTSNLEDYIDNENGILIEEVTEETVRETVENLPYTMSVMRDTFSYKKYTEVFFHWLKHIESN